MSCRTPLLEQSSCANKRTVLPDKSKEEEKMGSRDKDQDLVNECQDNPAPPGFKWRFER